MVIMIKSRKLRNSAKGKDCTLRLTGVCNFNSETTVLAHIGRNRGIGMKCHDTFAVYACSNCHSKIDTDSKESNAVDLIRALEETQCIMIRDGLLSAK